MPLAKERLTVLDMGESGNGKKICGWKVFWLVNRAPDTDGADKKLWTFAKACPLLGRRRHLVPKYEMQ